MSNLTTKSKEYIPLIKKSKDHPLLISVDGKSPTFVFDDTESNKYILLVSVFSGVRLYGKAIEIDKDTLEVSDITGKYNAFSDSSKEDYIQNLCALQNTQCFSTYSLESEIITRLIDNGYKIEGFNGTVDEAKELLPVYIDKDDSEAYVKLQCSKMEVQLNDKLQLSSDKKISISIDDGNTDDSKSAFVVCISGPWRSPRDGILKAVSSAIKSNFTKHPDFKRLYGWDNTPEGRYSGGRFEGYSSNTYSFDVNVGVFLVTQAKKDEVSKFRNSDECELTHMDDDCCIDF